MGGWLCNNRNLFAWCKNWNFVTKGNLTTRTNTKRRTFVAFRFWVFAVILKLCLLVFDLQVRKPACYKVLARLHRQQQQVKTKNEAKNSHQFAYYKSCVFMLQRGSKLLLMTKSRSEIITWFKYHVKKFNHSPFIYRRFNGRVVDYFLQEKPELLDQVSAAKSARHFSLQIEDA